MKKSSSFHFLNLLCNSDTLHFLLAYGYCEPRWACHTGLIFSLEYEKKFAAGERSLSTCQRRTFPWYDGCCFLLSIWIFNLSLYDGLGTKGWGLFWGAAEQGVSRIFGFKYFFPWWLLSSQATGQHGEQGSTAWLLSPAWTAEQPKRPLKGESPHCPQAAQMPETSLLLRSWTQLGHPHSTGLKLHWVSMGIKTTGLGPRTSSESSSESKAILPGISSRICLDALWVISLALPAGIRTVARGKLILWCPCKWIKKSFQIQLRKVFQAPVNSRLSMLDDYGSRSFSWKYLENKHAESHKIG